MWRRGPLKRHTTRQERKTIGAALSHFTLVAPTLPSPRKEKRTREKHDGKAAQKAVDHRGTVERRALDKERVDRGAGRGQSWRANVQAKSKPSVPM